MAPAPARGPGPLAPPSACAAWAAAAAAAVVALGCLRSPAQLPLAFFACSPRAAAAGKGAAAAHGNPAATGRPGVSSARAGAFPTSAPWSAFVLALSLCCASRSLLRISSRRRAQRAPRGARGGQLVARAAGPTLFGSMGSRSPLVNWYLFEIGQEFDMVDAASVDRRSAEFPHPFGQIPALRDGEVSVFESGAILLYLADKYGGLDTPEKRAEANKWVVWANATLDGICFKEDGNGRVLDTGLRGEPKAVATLDAILADREFILGNGEEAFSVADVAIGSYLLYVPIFFQDIDVSRWPNVQRYMLQLCQRPAYARAFGGGTSEGLVKILSAKKEGKLFGMF